MTKYRHKHLVRRMFTPYAGLVIMTLLIIIFSAILTNWSNYNQINDFTEGWTLEDGTVADLDKIHDDISFYNILPEIKNDGETLSFRAKNIIVSVYIDGKLKKDYQDLEMQPSLHYKAPGKYFVQIPLRQEYSGKTVEIRILSPYKNDSSCNIKNIQIGDASQILKVEIQDKLFSASICLILICTGIIFIILAKALSNYSKDNNNLLYLGTFTVVVGAWALSETSLLQLLYDNSSFWHLITGLTLPLTITPLFLFFKKRYNTTTMMPVVVVNIVTILIYIIIVFMHAMQIADIHETITLSHINIIAGTAFTCYYAIKIFIASKFKDISFWGMMAIAICATIDIVVYRLQITTDNSVFTRMGLVIYIWCLGIEIIREYISAYNTYLKTEIIAKAAYYDILTDFYNRTSMIEDTRRLDRSHKTGISMIIFDMNNLKYINDIHGHLNGDNAIIEAASYIRDEFENYGKCYRTGGDEFVFISNNPMSGTDVESHIKNLESALNKRNESFPEDRPWPLLIATGYATFDDKCTAFNDVFEKADKMMYDRKQELKKLYPEMNLRHI